ncbi:MAG: MoaD/ThiS family protein, partial [Nitrososphaerota archaeon]
PFYELVGERQICVKLRSGCSVAELLETLVRTYDGFKDLLLEYQDGDRTKYLFVVVNGVQAEQLKDGWEHTLQDGDVVMIVPFVAGR